MGFEALNDLDLITFESGQGRGTKEWGEAGAIPALCVSKAIIDGFTRHIDATNNRTAVGQRPPLNRGGQRASKLCVQIRRSHAQPARLRNDDEAPNAGRQRPRRPDPPSGALFLLRPPAAAGAPSTHAANSTGRETPPARRFASALWRRQQTGRIGLAADQPRKIQKRVGLSVWKKSLSCASAARKASIAESGSSSARKASARETKAAAWSNGSLSAKY
jgi:hypothetical protein